jgi:hypothetical protein
MRQWIAVLEHHIAQKDPAKPGTDTLDDVCCPHKPAKFFGNTASAFCSASVAKI